jgi:hypothetical protein
MINGDQPQLSPLPVARGRLVYRSGANSILCK